MCDIRNYGIRCFSYRDWSTIVLSKHVVISLDVNGQGNVKSSVYQTDRDMNEGHLSSGTS